MYNKIRTVWIPYGYQFTIMFIYVRELSDTYDFTIIPPCLYIL